MKQLIVFIIFLFVVFANCKNKEVIDTTKVNSLLLTTDSLYKKITNVSEECLNTLYKITEDSLLADSLSKIAAYPDTIVFYQFLSLNITDINETYYLSQREIIFTQDQLIALKQEAIENEIDDSSFLMSLEKEKEIIKLLRERIDTNIVFIKSKCNLVFSSNHN